MPTEQLTLFRSERFGVTLRALRAIQIELGCDPAIVPGPEAAAYLLEQILHLARLVKPTIEVKNDTKPTE